MQVCSGIWRRWSVVIFRCCQDLVFLLGDRLGCCSSSDGPLEAVEGVDLYRTGRREKNQSVSADLRQSIHIAISRDHRESLCRESRPVGCQATQKPFPSIFKGWGLDGCDPKHSTFSWCEILSLRQEWLYGGEYLLIRHFYCQASRDFPILVLLMFWRRFHFFSSSHRLRDCVKRPFLEDDDGSRWNWDSESTRTRYT